jgi:hypothetical protein
MMTGTRVWRGAAVGIAAVTLALMVATGGCGGAGAGGTEAAGAETASQEPAGAQAADAAASAGAALAAAVTSSRDMSAPAQELVGDYALGDWPCFEVAVPGAVAAVTCDVAPITFGLARMADDEGVAAAFAAEVEADRASPQPWHYETDPATVMGQAYALAGARRAHVHWTNEQELVVAHASQAGGDSLAALEEWWGSDGSVIGDGTGGAG